MRFFPILFTIGIILIAVGIIIHGNYDDCLSDFRIGDLVCASESVMAFGTISFFLGLSCILGSFIFLRKRKSKTGILES